MLNKALLGLDVGKEYEIYTSVLERVTLVMFTNHCWISSVEVIIIRREIKQVLLQIQPVCGTEMTKCLSCRRVGDRGKDRDGKVIGDAQRWKDFDNIRRKIRS